MDAMLSMTIGEAGESFRCFNDDIQEHYMHGCGLLAKENHELYKLLDAMTHNAGTKGGEHEGIAGKHS